MDGTITPIQFANKHFGEYIIKEDEIIPELCPICKGGENRNKHTFALNVEKNTYCCLRGKCGASGTFYQLLCEFNEITPKQTRPWQPPKEKLIDPEKELIDYMNLRKISVDTWKGMKVRQYQDSIAFPYYENGKLVMIKFRSVGKDKKIWRSKDGKPVFWGMDKCETDKPLIICEGEMDKLALDEAGVKNSVSVPSGTSDLTCIDICWDWITQFKKITIWTDNDEAGVKLKSELIKRLGEWRCSFVECEYKDINICLYKEGKEKVKQLVITPKEIKLKSVLSVADLDDFDINNCLIIKSKIRRIDKEIVGFREGEISVWTGRDGSGKSTFLSQMLIETIRQGFNATVYTGEMTGHLFRYWLELQMAGEDDIKETNNESPNYYITGSKKEELRNWYRGKLYIYDSLEDNMVDGILEMFEYTARRYDSKVFLVDNLMSIIFDSNERNYYHKQGEAVTKFKNFAKKFLVHVHIVAHPRKTKGDIQGEDISGSREIINRADNVFVIERLDDGGGAIKILKNRFLGRIKKYCPLDFEPKSKIFTEKENYEDIDGTLWNEKRNDWV